MPVDRHHPHGMNLVGLGISSDHHFGAPGIIHLKNMLQYSRIMTSIVQEHLEELKALCRKYHVAELFLFGSAANGEFQEESSDLDFLVNFQPMETFAYADAFFDFADDLERLFNRPVDLVIERAIRNPYFKEEIDETKVKLYAA